MLEAANNPGQLNLNFEFTFSNILVYQSTNQLWAIRRIYFDSGIAIKKFAFCSLSTCLSNVLAHHHLSCGGPEPTIFKGLFS